MTFDPNANYARAAEPNAPPPAPREPGTPGAPAKYNESYARTVFQLAVLGLSTKKMAEALGISTSTFHAWLTRHPEFEEQVREGKAIADAKVAASLFQRACGYEHPDVEVFYDSKRGQVVTVPTVKRYPPDTQAAIFWLKNRQPELWRDRVALEHSGPEGGPIEVATMSVEELLALRQQALTAATGGS